MKTTKKFTGILLALLIIAAIIPTAAFADAAADENPDESTLSSDPPAVEDENKGTDANTGGDEAEAFTGSCKVSIDSYTLEVPYGKTLEISWEFKDLSEYAKGWSPVFNGEPAFDKSSGDTAGGFKLISVPWNARTNLIKNGKPAGLSFSPTEAQCTSGSAALSPEITPLKDEDCTYTIHFVVRNTGAELGTMSRKTSLSYGEQTIKAGSDRLIKNHVYQNYKGYQVDLGVYGAVDLQPFTVKVLASGKAEPQNITVYVTVNHGTVTPLHTQPVDFVCGGETVYHTDVPCSNWINLVTECRMDMTEAAKTLRQMGYELDTEKEYTVKCANEYPHDPAVSVIEVTKLELEVRNQKDPTCTEPGYTGDEYIKGTDELFKKGEVIEATGHKTELTGKVEPTCTKPGYTGDTVCSNCGETIEKGEEIPALGHDWGRWTDTQDGKHHERCCNRCGECERAEHDWDSGTVTKQATDNEKGEITYTCRSCGAQKTVSYDKNSKPKTGDEGNALFWLGLLAVSATGSVMLIKKRRAGDSK